MQNIKYIILLTVAGITEGKQTVDFQNQKAGVFILDPLLIVSSEIDDNNSHNSSTLLPIRSLVT